MSINAHKRACVFRCLMFFFDPFRGLMRIFATYAFQQEHQKKARNRAKTFGKKGAAEPQRFLGFALYSADPYNLWGSAVPFFPKALARFSAFF